MPRLLRKALFWALVAYAVSLPVSFILGGALFARPVKERVGLTELAEAMDPGWDRTFLSGVREIEVPLGARSRLRATVMGGNSHATIILLHPARQNRLACLPAAYALWQSGFDVVLLDRRAHGSSDGEMLPLFGGELPDLAAVVDFVVDQGLTGSARIGLFGLDDAGTSCLIAAAADPRIDAVAASDPALRAGDFIGDFFASWFHLPRTLLFLQTTLAVEGLLVLSHVERDQLDAEPRLAGLEARVLLLDRAGVGSPDGVREVLEALPAGTAELEWAASADDAVARAVAFFDRTL